MDLLKLGLELLYDLLRTRDLPAHNLYMGLHRDRLAEVDRLVETPKKLVDDLLGGVEVLPALLGLLGVGEFVGVFEVYLHGLGSDPAPVFVLDFF